MKLIFLMILIWLGAIIPTHSQSSSGVSLSVLADCVAFAGSLEGFYESYREATGDNQYVEEEKSAAEKQQAWAQVLYQRLQVEITRKRDMDALNAHMGWIYSSAKLLPDQSGLGNSVVIFGNRVRVCEQLLLG